MNSIKRFMFVTVFLSTWFLQAAPSQELDRLIAHLVARIEKSDSQLFIIGIGGCPGVGKSTLAEQLAASFTKLSIPSAILHIDDFNLPARERKDHEWNTSYLYLDKLKEVTNAIVRGEKLIDKPTYSQITGECDSETLDLTSTRVLFFEGLYATCSKDPLNFSSLCSETIFIIADKEDIYQWKKARNETRVRPRNEEEFRVHMAAMFREYERNIAYSEDEASILVRKNSFHQIFTVLNSNSEVGTARGMRSLKLPILKKSNSVFSRK